MRLPILALGGLLLVSACSGPEKKVVAEVDGRKITVGDVILQYRSMSPTVRPFIDTLEGKRGFLNDIINKNIMKAEAEKRGLAELPEIVEIIDNFENQLLAEEYYKVTIHDKVHITEEEVRNLYELEGEEARLRLIMTDSQESARELKRKIEQGADFVTLAREHSLDPTARRGGDLGFHTWADYGEEITTALRPLQEGQTSDVIPYGEKFAILRLDARRPLPQGDFESERGELEKKMRQITEARLAVAWGAEKRASADVKVNAETITYLSGKMQEALDNPLQFMGQAPLHIADADRERVLVTFSGRTWTLDDYLYHLRAIPIKLRPKFTASEAELAEFVASLATREVAVEEARQMGLQDLPEVREAVDKFRERQVVTRLHNEVVRVEPPSEEDIALYYEQHRASLISPAKARTREAVLRTEDEALQWLRNIRRGDVTLKTVVEEESIDLDNAARGGVSDWIYRGSEPVALSKAVFATEVGRTGGPVNVRGRGWVIFRVMEAEGEAQMSLEDARDTITRQIVEERRIQLFDEWLTERREESDIRVDEDVLREIDFGAPPRPDLEQPGSDSPTPVTPS